MTNVERQEISEVVARVATWPPAERIELARKILETVEVAPASQAAGRRGVPSQQVLGLWKPDGPVANDEETQGILEEKLLKKYGS